MVEVGVGAKPEKKLRPTTFQLELVPVGKGVKQRWMVDYSVPNEVEFTVILQAKPGTTATPDTFKIMLHKYGKRWLVNTWVPYEPPPIKANPND